MDRSQVKHVVSAFRSGQSKGIEVHKSEVRSKWSMQRSIRDRISIFVSDRACPGLNAFARFYAGAVQLANLGALTRILLSGVLLSKF